MKENLPREDRPRSVEFRCFKAKQPIGEFYVGVMPFKMLCDIAFFDVRHRLQDQRDIEKYLGIQRPLNEGRVRELEHYVNSFDASFPNSIIIAVESRCASFDEDNGIMKLSNYIGETAEDSVLFRNIARVIDGQHRIAGLYEFHGEHFDLNVTLFVGADIADQAYIFSTVNLEQTKVSKSLAFDLFSLARSRSPQKTCHNIAIALDSRADSPVYHRIKRLGVVTEGRTGETLTQATFVEGVMRYISRSPDRDRDILIRGKTLPRPSPEELQKMPLRPFFIEERDLQIAEIVFNYLTAVSVRWPAAWNAAERGAMLQKTNGFRALMRFFPLAYGHLGGYPRVPTADEFQKIFARVDVPDTYFRTDNFKPGTSGESELFHLFEEQTGLYQM